MSKVIGFDMGGTSTNVSNYPEQVLETVMAGVAVQSPQLEINTVASEGGSRLLWALGVFKVGSDSVGTHPGPVCYHKGGQLAVTDANLVLGRRTIPALFTQIFGPSLCLLPTLPSAIVSRLATVACSVEYSEDDDLTGCFISLADGIEERFPDLAVVGPRASSFEVQ